MGVTRTDTEQTAEHQLDPEAQTAQHAVPSRRADTHAPATQLTSAAVGENCSNCGAPLASDQRYCIQCGQRRGNSRFALAAPATQSVTTVTSSGPPPFERSRWHGSAATVIAGIATLVLAMGVGVLIGHSGSTNAAAKSSPPTVVNLGGGSAGTSTGASTGGSASHAARHHAAAPKTERAKATKAATAKKPTTQAVQKASHAASSVLGGNSGGQQQSTISSGAACKAGSAGCQGGHFTGNFFGQ